MGRWLDGTIGVIGRSACYSNKGGMGCGSDTSVVRVGTRSAWSIGSMGCAFDVFVRIIRKATCGPVGCVCIGLDVAVAVIVVIRGHDGYCEFVVFGREYAVL